MRYEDRVFSSRKGFRSALLNEAFRSSGAVRPIAHQLKEVTRGKGERTQGRKMLYVDSAEKPWCLENPKFSGDQITLPTSQKRVYGLFKASFFDCTIKFFAAFEKLRVFQRNRMLRRDPSTRNP